MITEAETFKLKSKILAEIATLFEHNLKAGKIADEAEANAIVAFVNDEIDKAFHAAKFTRAVRKFCEKFPAFAAIEHKLNAMRQELLQQIGQECISNLMEQDPERWETLSNELEQRDEDTLGPWMNSLPEANKAAFIEKAYNPA